MRVQKKHFSKLSTMEFMFIAGNKHCMIIHHIQPLHKSSPENSSFLPNYHVRDCDEKGESSATKSLYSSGVRRKWQGPVLKKSGLYRITKKLYFKPSFIFSMEAYLDICFTSPKEEKVIINPALKLSQVSMIKLQNTDHLIQSFSPPVN